MISVVRFDGMIPLPGSDEHVSGFFASDGWALSEADGKLIVEGHDKRYVFTGYAYGVVEEVQAPTMTVEEAERMYREDPEPPPEPKTGKRRRA